MKCVNDNVINGYCENGFPYTSKVLFDGCVDNVLISFIVLAPFVVSVRDHSFFISHRS